MEISFGSASLQLSETQFISVFWALAVAFAFNTAYLLFVWDRREASVTRARIFMTIFVGSLIVIGTYADALASKPFAMKDCLLLALVAAHGWMAEEMVQKVLRAAADLRPVAGNKSA